MYIQIAHRTISRSHSRLCVSVVKCRPPLSLVSECPRHKIRKKKESVCRKMIARMAFVIDGIEKSSISVRMRQDDAYVLTDSAFVAPQKFQRFRFGIINSKRKISCVVEYFIHFLFPFVRFDDRRIWRERGMEYILTDVFYAWSNMGANKVIVCIKELHVKELIIYENFR